MKQFVVSRDFKKYLVLGMLFFQAHAFGSDRTPPGDVSKLVNINRIKIDALSKQVATQIDAVVALITADFNNTMTAIADIHCSGGSTGTASCDSAGTFTAIAALQADLDACCITLGNKIDAIVTSSGSCNLSGTYTAIAGLQSDLDVCCLILNSKVDALSTLVIKDFNGTYTAIAAIQCSGSSTSTGSCDFNGTYTAIAGLRSDLDVCCLTLNSKVDLLSNTVITDFNGTFTAIAAIPAANFSGTYTAIAGLRSDLDVCCVTLNSKVDALSNTVIADFNGTFTAIAAIPAVNFSGTYTALAGLQSDLDVCCLILNSKVDALSTLVIKDFNGTFTAIAAIQCSGGSTSTGSCDFNGTYTAIAGLQSDLDVCCVTLNSKVDALSNTVIADFNGTFTAIAAIPAANFAGTYTAIAALRSDLDACCATIGSQITTFSANVNQDFNNTFTAIAGVSSLITQDFNNTMTALNACCVTLNSKVDALSTLVIADFNGTFTAIAAIQCSGGSTSTGSCDLSGTYTALAALSILITQNFNNTFTAIDGIASLITQDFNSTMTALAACCSLLTTLTSGDLCAPLPLTQATFDAAGGTLILSTTGASYCLSQNITGTLIISASDVTVDLNTHSLIGTIEVQGTAANATIKNGNVKPVAPTSAPQAAILIDAGASKAFIANCYIVCADTATAGFDGRNGITNAGSNTIIQNCFIQAGGTTSVGNVGGDGIHNTGTNIQVRDCTISLSAGGGSSLVSTAFVTNGFGSNTVSPITIPANTVGSPILVGNSPFGIAITPDGLTAYVVNNTDNSISVIDTASRAVTATIPQAGFGFNRPLEIAITPDGSKAYVTNSVGASVTVFSIPAHNFIQTITVGNFPLGVAITPDSSTAYVSNNTDNTISVIDTATEAVAFTMDNTQAGFSTPGNGFNQPGNIAITPNGTKGYVANGNNNIIVFNIPANTFQANIPLGGISAPNSIAITTDGLTAYATAGTNVKVINTGTDSVTSTIPIAGALTPSLAGIAITQDDLNVYALDQSNSEAVTFARATPLVQTTIPVGAFPTGIAISPPIMVSGQGGNGIVQQGNNGKFVRNAISSNASFGNDGIVVTAGSNCNFIEECEAISCGASGFSMLTTGTLNLIECLASCNVSHGFDLVTSTGRGVIRSCMASQNGGCGFNDRSASLYQYIGNAAEGNGATPAVPTGDSNYCDFSVASTFVAPSGPGFAPFYQNARTINGTFAGNSNWDNITLN